MKKYCQWIFCVLFFSGLSGCATVSEYVTPTIPMTTNTSNVGHGQVVAVKVVDNRYDDTIGVRGAALIGSPVKMILASNSTEVIADAISNGLRARGFRPVDAENHPGVSPELTVSIVRVGSDMIPPPIGMPMQNSPDQNSLLLTSTLHVRAIHNGKSFEKTYRVNMNADFAQEMSKESDQKVIGQLLSRNLNRMLFDKQLTGFLVG